MQYDWLLQKHGAGFVFLTKQPHTGTRRHIYGSADRCMVTWMRVVLARPSSDYAYK